MFKIKNVSKKNLNLTLFLLGIIITLLCLILVEYFTGLIKADLPLRIDMSSFSYGILFFLFFLLGLILLIKWKPQYTNLLLAIFLGPIFGCLLLSIISIKSGSGPIIKSIQTPNSSNEDGINRIVLPIIFDNGSSILKKSDKQKILEYLELFDDCTSKTILVRGFASSRPYKEYSNHKNMLLANKRASFVADFLSLNTNKNFQPYLWNNYTDMRIASRLIDEGSDNKLIPRFEKLNRRVELIWEDMTCLRIYSSDASLEKISSLQN